MSFSCAIFFDFGAILGGLGRPKWSPKSIFGRFFAMFFSTASWNRFFCDFYRFFLSPNLESAAHSQCFATIFTKSTFSKNMRKKLDFGSILGGQKNEKSRNTMLKNMRFLNIDFYAFFYGF